MPTKSLTLSFDIGYASIGWCVLDTTASAPAEPEILGTGVVTFPTDDCLASKRRDLRRTRRHIRSTRQRIERMKRWLQHRGVLTRADLDKPGHPAPFLLAAAALEDKKQLTPWELWTVLRWYAHNRGYDGNSLWSRDETNDDDTEKETNAKNIMAKHGTTTMAETVCACLSLDVADHSTRISSALPYKTLNAAYPREIVYREVGEILRKHTDVIPGLDTEAVRFLLKNAALTHEERDKLTAADIKLPRRYHGGLLFGQLVPRFDNRIISRCPITWAKTYDESVAEGKTDSEARKLAEKFAKVPAKKCSEFLEYRFARILANLRANGEPIAAELRLTLLNLARQQGRLTVTDLKREFKKYYGKPKTNISDYFTLHPDSADALVLDPVAKLIHTKQILTPIWNLLSAETQEKLKNSWKKNKAVSLAEIIHLDGKREELEAALQPAFLKANKPKQGKSKYADLDQYLNKTTIAPDFPSGRAPYARPILKQVLTEVLAGYDPTKAAHKTSASEGETKDQDGILYPLNNKDSRIRTLEAERPLDQLTNNHLVRHRLLILDRLTEDITKEFLTEGHEVSQVIIEVARELKEFSGKDIQKIKKALGAKLSQHKAAVRRLEEKGITPTYNLIRKCRIAMDLNWTCPFTHRTYGESELPDLEIEHIIPRSQRLSDSMAGLVLTRPEINKLKANRTAVQFVNDSVDDVRIVAPSVYEKWVKKLRVADRDRFPDDNARQTARKNFLLVEDYNEKERTFTDGQLTQTSHLAKLAMRDLTQRFPNATIDPIPGPVTADLRKAWDLAGTLSGVCPEILDKDDKVKPKGEIRGLTHMHHALDAATIAIAAHYFPFNKNGQDQKGKLWRALLKRNRTSEEQDLLQKTGLFKTYQKPAYDHEGTPKSARIELKLEDLPASLKQSLRLSLAQARVMQHVPADRSGAKAELTTWGIVSTEGDDAKITLRQNATTVEEGRRIRDPKTREERAGKLLGPNPKNGIGKLAAIKGAMIIGENYGLALDPTPTVIPFHNVSARLDELRKANGGKSIRVLRNGMLFRIDEGIYKGAWMLRSVADGAKGIKIRMTFPDRIPDKTSGVKWAKDNVNFLTLLKAGLTILPQYYTGHVTMD